MTKPTPRAAGRLLRRCGRRLSVEIADRKDRRAGRLDARALLDQALGDSGLTVERFLDRLESDLPGAQWDSGTPAAIVKALAAAEPTWCERTIKAADRIAEGHVRLLGLDDVDLLATGMTSVGSLPWHCDMTSAFCFDPGRYYRAVVVPTGKADIKVPWELSRCQHLPTLAMAALASGDSRYVDVIGDHISDWITSNPLRRGVNWACTMDVAIRAVNWLWAYELLAGTGALEPGFQTVLVASLVEHARHISANIEIYAGGLTTNHTTADYAGLAHLALFLADLEESVSWRAQAIAGLERCISQQINEDGCDFEGSTSYHRLTLELFLAPYLRLRHAGASLSACYGERLRAMFEALYETARPDGLMPVVGDADDGRLQILHDYFGWVPQDHRYLLAVGGSLFSCPEWLAEGLVARGGREELAWQLGPTTLPHALAAPRGAEHRRGQRAFPGTGRYVFRSGGDYLLVNADPVGTNGMGNHHHNHWLSYELVLAGKPVAVDPGSFTYTKDLEQRDAFRSTRAHNTVMIDGEEQCEFSGAFGMCPGPAPRVVEAGPGLDRIVAEHYGYERLSDPVQHRRTLVLLQRALIVLDQVSGTGVHEAESFVHLPSSAQLINDGTTELPPPVVAALKQELTKSGLAASAWQLDQAVRFVLDEVVIQVVPFGGVQVAVEPGWVSERYGQRRASPVFVTRWRLQGSSLSGYSVAVVQG
jgi:hypothetical protein